MYICKLSIKGTQESLHRRVHSLWLSVLPKHTLFKVLFFILAKFKNYTLFILYFSQILKKYFIMG